MNLATVAVTVGEDAIETRALPVLDLGPFLAGDEGAKQSLAGELRQAAEEIGFLAIANHGVSQDLLDRMLEQNERFCALPIEQKLAMKIDHNQRGYIQAKATMIKHSTYHEHTKWDLNETCVFATEHSPDDPHVKAGRQFYGQNQWPENLPGFRETVDEYMTVLEGLGRSLLPLWALALELPEEFFSPYFENGYTYFRMAHYPPKPEADENEFALGAHADTGFMTLLPSPDVKGLEIMDTNNIWFRPDKVPDVIHVNIGQFLERWSNHRFRATPHRVAVPRDNERYTTPVFINPDFEKICSCLPTCQSPATPPRYPPESYWDFFKWYMNNSYPHYDEFHKGA